MPNISKTPLFGALRKTLFLSLAANRENISSEEIAQRAEAAAISRRAFMQYAGKTAIAAGAAGFSGGSFFSATLTRSAAPRIVVIGAGMAGLSALHAFKKAGYHPELYEASGRTGGRILSVRNALGEGLWTEFGGEFIDSDHADMHALAAEFKLETVDLEQAAEQKLVKETFFFEGKNHTQAQVAEQFRGFADQIKADAGRLPEDLNYRTKDPAVIKLDQTSLSEYLEKIGARGWIKNLIEAAYESEYGLSPQVQSSINLISLISSDTSGGNLHLFGDSDERFIVGGGNHSIPNAIAQKYAESVNLHRTLERIAKKGDSFYLYISGLSAPVKADFVVLALPFSRLKNVEINVPMPEPKWDAINGMGFGTNSKLMIGMKQHFWREQGFRGLCYSDIGIPNGWDNAQLQTRDNQAAGLTILLGGASGIALGKGSAADQKNTYLPLWDQMFTGAVENHNGKFARMHWPTYPYSEGSYTCYTTGQYTSISGIEAAPVGNLFFAGEHCGKKFSGYMNGAAQSGREAAECIMSKIARLAPRMQNQGCY